MQRAIFHRAIQRSFHTRHRRLTQSSSIFSQVPFVGTASNREEETHSPFSASSSVPANRSLITRHPHRNFAFLQYKPKSVSATCTKNTVGVVVLIVIGLMTLCVCVYISVCVGMDVRGWVCMGVRVCSHRCLRTLPPPAPRTFLSICVKYIGNENTRVAACIEFRLRSHQIVFIQSSHPPNTRTIYRTRRKKIATILWYSREGGGVVSERLKSTAKRTAPHLLLSAHLCTV